ncbi:MAG: endolytic transglycosylase MltG [Thermodesulfobacteriota bacterium]
MRKKTEKILIVVVTAMALVSVHFYTVLYAPASNDQTPKIVNVAQGASFGVVADNLVTQGVLKSTEGFVLAASLKNAKKKIKAGEYELTSAMTPVEVLNILIEGRVKRYFVTIPEGYNIKEIAAAIENAGLAKKEEFLKLAFDKNFAKSLGFKGFEGYLFPDTYQFTKTAGAEEIIKKMTGRFLQVYDAEFRALAEGKGLGMKELVTIASIIEKESGNASEMPRVSAVFWNRLKKRMPLQSDPTVIYGINDFDGNLTRAHLKQPTPYNTYVKFGLPPTPIANPGKAAMDAALNPANENSLYFVSKNDGTHYFSSTLREHNSAVEIYQKSLIKKTQRTM